jgi:hypothetical protein
MSSMRETIEARLSELLGARVKFQQLKVLPLKRTIVAEGLSVTGTSDRPILTVARITAQIAISKLLVGEFSIREMVIESPELFLSWKPGRLGPTGNSGPKFEAQFVRIEGGKFTWRKDSLVITASQVAAELKQSADCIELTATIRELAGRGRAELTGHVASGDFSKLLDASASASLRFANGLQISIESPSLQTLLD